MSADQTCEGCRYRHYVRKDGWGTSMSGWGCLATGGHAIARCSQYSIEEKPADVEMPPWDPQTAIDKAGWWAIKHNDGWWAGTADGVICYEDYEMARVALTMRWQMDGGGKLLYRIKQFPGVDTVAGEAHVPKKSAEQALTDYENTHDHGRIRVRSTDETDQDTASTDGPPEGGEGAAPGGV